MWRDKVMDFIDDVNLIVEDNDLNENLWDWCSSTYNYSLMDGISIKHKITKKMVKKYLLENQ